MSEKAAYDARSTQERLRDANTFIRNAQRTLTESAETRDLVDLKGQKNLLNSIPEETQKQNATDLIAKMEDLRTKRL